MTANAMLEDHKLDSFNFEERYYFKIDFGTVIKLRYSDKARWRRTVQYNTPCYFAACVQM
eukprot:3404597-Amphidinium_carterae.1